MSPKIDTTPSGSDQLPIVANADQLPSLAEHLTFCVNNYAEEVEISQSRGPALLHVIFVKAMYEGSTKTDAIDIHGDVMRLAAYWSDKNPTAEPDGDSDPVTVGEQDSRGEHDPTL